jgi:DNA-binding LacI/PurR family transcriptional regulator
VTRVFGRYRLWLCTPGSEDEMTGPAPGYRPNRTTLADVAREAGVSRATASRVIAGYGSVAAETRELVSAAAARLGYIPDAAGRALASGTGFRLVVAVTGTTASVLDDPYVHRVVGSAATVCAHHGVGVSLYWLPLHSPWELGVLAEDRGVSGVLLVNTTNQVLAAVPTAPAGRIVSIGVGSAIVPSFDVDTACSTTAMVHHLYASGRRRIAMVSGPAWLPCTWRAVDAYRAAMRAAGLQARLVPGDFTASGGSTATVTVLSRWPDTDAVLASSDSMALGAMAALRKRSLDVPGDVAVAGFDDIPFAALSTPSLTTASHPVDRIAASAATAILESTRVPSTTLYATELIHRESA